MTDVPYGVLLSGGVDSNAVVSQMAALSPDAIDTFTVSFSDSSFDEAVYFRRNTRITIQHWVHDLTVGATPRTAPTDQQ